MALTFRDTKGSPLTSVEADANVRTLAAGLPGPREIRLSRFAVADGDLQMHSSARGTDNTAAILALVNAQTGPFRLIVDGAFAGRLPLRSGMTVFCPTPQDGFVLPTGTNKSLVYNLNRQFADGAFNIIDKDIQIIGGTYNGNGHNADGTENQTSTGTEGMMHLLNLRGVDGLVIRDVKLLNGRMFASMISNARYVDLTNVAVYHSPSIPAAAFGATADQTFRYNHDAFHFGGPIYALTANGLRGYSSDDFFALCANDGLQRTPGTISYGLNVFDPYASYGPITNVRASKLLMESCKFGLRMLSTTELIDDVQIDGLSGSSKGHFLTADRYDATQALNRPNASSTGYFGNITLTNVEMQLTGPAEDVVTGAYLAAAFEKVTFANWHVKGTSAAFPLIKTPVNNSIAEAYWNNLSVRESPGAPALFCDLAGAVQVKHGDFFSIPPAAASTTAAYSNAIIYQGSNITTPQKTSVAKVATAGSLTTIFKVFLPDSFSTGTALMGLFSIQTSNGQADNTVVFAATNYGQTTGAPASTGLGLNTYTNALTRSTILNPFVGGADHIVTVIQYAKIPESAQIWIDGVQQTMETMQPPHGFYSWSANIAVGGFYDPTTNNWPVAIKQFRLFGSGLTNADRIAAEAEVANAV